MMRFRNTNKMRMKGENQMGKTDKEGCRDGGAEMECMTKIGNRTKNKEGRGNTKRDQSVTNERKKERNGERAGGREGRRKGESDRCDGKGARRKGRIEEGRRGEEGRADQTKARAEHPSLPCATFHTINSPTIQVPKAIVVIACARNAITCHIPHSGTRTLIPHS